MKHLWLVVLLVTGGCASSPSSPSGGDPTFRSLTEAQAYYDRLEQQQRKMLTNFPSIKRAPCPPEPRLPEPGQGPVER
jgi:hypothetical protein